MTEPPDVLAYIQSLAEQLPARVPSELRAGAAVLEVLRLNTATVQPWQPVMPLGVRVVVDRSYGLWEWRMFDQVGEVMNEGEL